ncbi:MAG: TonB-dependent receptor [Arcobacter sp.]|nr:MAG: TonB-dependent receptor [Arcobacter sp.]
MAETQLDDVRINTSAFDAQVKSVSSKQLEEEQASDVKDILKSLPSVNVDGNARYGQKVYVRGLEDKFANITVDGAKLGGQLFHHSGDQTIDASLLKITSVELGPNSALSGQGVINGSFVYETKDPSDFLAEGENFGGKVTLGYQTGYERKTGTVAVFGKINEKLEFVGMGTISSDGTLRLGNGEKIKSKESKLESALAKLVIKPNDYNTFKISYNRYKDGGNRQLSGEKVGTEDTDNDYNSISRDTFTLNYEYKPDNELVNVKANAYYNKQYLTRESTNGTDRTSNLTYTEPQRKYINSTSGMDLRNSSLLGIHKITFGTDYTHEEQEIEADTLRVYSNNTTKNLDFEGGEINNHGLYLEDEMAFDNWIVTLGARYDYYKLGGIYNGTFSQLSPKLRLKYQASENLTLRSGYGHIFKGPALGETLAVDSTDIQTGDTNAQTGNNFEVGFDYDLTKALNADDAIVGFNAYRYNVDNYAHTTKNNSLTSQSDIMIWGLETMFSYKKDKLGLNLSHTYTDGRQKDLVSGITYDPKTTNIHIFKIGANYQITKEFKFNYNSQFVPGNEWLSYSSRSGSTTEYKRAGYAVHDINLTYNPSSLKNTSFNFGIGNLFDKKYVTHTGFGSQTTSTNKSYEVGRNFKFQVSYKF